MATQSDYNKDRINYLDLITVLKDMGEKHKQIAQTSSGDIFQIDLDKDTLFPLFHIQPNSASVSHGLMKYNFTFFVMDMTLEDRTNEDVVLSHTQNIMTDIWATLNAVDLESSGTTWIEETTLLLAHHRDYELTGMNSRTPTMDCFTERFKNLLSGWTLNVEIVTKYSGLDCDATVIYD